MSIFDGIFGTGLPNHQRRQIGNRQPSGCENAQIWHSQRAYLEYNPAQGVPIQYHVGMMNNITVECLYCRTPRESRHKTCKGCGATAARRV